MGMLAYFEKISEEEATVSYRVGNSPTNMPNIIRLDKATHRVLPIDGRVTPYLLAAAQKIARYQRDNGIWPARGVKAS